MKEYHLGKQNLPADLADGVSVDWVLNWLMDAKDAHRARARKQPYGSAHPEGEGADDPPEEAKAV